ncbi:uncharacterized protein LOC115737657 isoform X2 [Rhodamnia argentea]|uniref:Uncharacterized protein LOC115737657 isoform X2 n=1 Tax=Rhodamnia argentea TaxID=178133 RepID=A0A8B8NT90_9MYRT|nr:uncharacterized protein LOC115737657 isoform X2 [Rhodamnia argentea]
MPGLAERNDQSSNASPVPSPRTAASAAMAARGFWSKQHDDVSYGQLQKFWSELSPQARQKLLRIDKQTLFEQARKNMYCSRCNGLLLEGFLQIVMYGKSFQQEGAVGHLIDNSAASLKTQDEGGLSVTNRCQEEIQDPSVHPWGGLTTTRDGSLTILDGYLFSKSLKGLQIVFDSARARERERELLYPDACGGGGRGWISQNTTNYGRGHGMRETCALHTARLSCDTLVDFWSALGEETRQSLLRMKEEDFIERLMYRDCRRNVIREFKELKELKRMRKEPRCTRCFCAADTAFQYEVSDETVHADWHQTFEDSVGLYHHFEWAIGTGEGKSDILEFENVGLSDSVQVTGLDLGGLNACFITLRAWKHDGRSTEIFVKAHALNGQQCVHSRLVVGNGFVTITRGESIRRFFEHAEEAEEEEDDDSMDKDRNELDGECSRPQKHAKSPELAREFLLDAAIVIFKEQVEKAFREGTARQNAHSIFVCLALKLLEERVHIACKEIITLEKQMKLLEEEEKEKREEEERKERKRTKEREKKLRRKERLKGKEGDREKKDMLDDVPPASYGLKDEPRPGVTEEPNETASCGDSICDTGDVLTSKSGSLDIEDETFSSGVENSFNESSEVDFADVKDVAGSFTTEISKISQRRPKFQKEGLQDQIFRWCDRRRPAVVSESSAAANRSESRYYNDNFEFHSRGMNGWIRQTRMNSQKSNSRNSGSKYCEKFLSLKNRMNDRYDMHSCSCNEINCQRGKVGPHFAGSRAAREGKFGTSSESAFDVSKNFHRSNKYNQVDYAHSVGRPKSRVNGSSITSRDMVHSRKVWEPMESQKCPRSNSDSDVTLIASSLSVQGKESGDDIKLVVELCSSEDSRDSIGTDQKVSNRKDFTDSGSGAGEVCESRPDANAADAHHSREATDEEVGSCLARNDASNRTSDFVTSATSNSDNCSSCLSEVDSNASSNHGNIESSSTSDSEDVCPHSERREALTCDSRSECCKVEAEAKEVKDRMEVLGGQPVFGFPLKSMGTSVASYTPVKTPHSSNDINGNLSVASEHRGTLPQMHSQSLYFQMFQGPTPIGYYPQNLVPWPAVHTNGLVPYPHPSNYLYAGPLGYGLDGNSGFCIGYDAMSHLTAVPNTGPVPVFQPAVKANSYYPEERNHIPNHSVSVKDANDVNKEKTVQTGLRSAELTDCGESRQRSSSAKVCHEDSGFSLFHFGGPVALSNVSTPNVGPDVGADGNISTKVSTDPVEINAACNKKETTIEEYNLFAASNGIRFSLY